MTGAAAFVLLFAAAAAAEEIKLEAYYPSPVASFSQLTTSSVTLLARDEGRVIVGTDESGINSPIVQGMETKLLVAGNGERAIELRSATDDPNLTSYPARQHNPLFISRRGRGSAAAPIPVRDGDVALSMEAMGYTGSGYVLGAAIDAVVDGVVAPRSMPGRMDIRTAPPGCAPPCAPVNRLVIRSNTRIGINVENPQSQLHVFEPAGVPMRLDGGLTTKLLIRPDPVVWNGWEYGLQGTHFVARTFGGAGLNSGLKLQDDGRVYLGRSVPNGAIAAGRKIDTDLPGAYMDMAGKWWGPSSRRLKQGVAPLGFREAEEALFRLEPVMFRYKTLPREPRAGFIAEDVPELLARPERDGLTVMDFAAVLTGVVQRQRARIDDHKARERRLRERLERLEKRLAESAR